MGSSGFSHHPPDTNFKFPIAGLLLFLWDFYCKCPFVHQFFWEEKNNTSLCFCGSSVSLWFLMFLWVPILKSQWQTSESLGSSPFVLLCQTAFSSVRAGAEEIRNQWEQVFDPLHSGFNFWIPVACNGTDRRFQCSCILGLESFW